MLKLLICGIFDISSGYKVRTVKNTAILAYPKIWENVDYRTAMFVCSICIKGGHRSNIEIHVYFPYDTPMSCAGLHFSDIALNCN